MAINKKSFSVILPTYKGAATIDQTFKSILNQDVSGIDLEVIVIIDGPDKAINTYIEKQKLEFENRGINFKIGQFKKNKGRFEARMAGAKLAEFDQLFFIDDRVYLDKDYFKKLKSISENLMLSNVIEFNGETNLISNSLYYIRRSLYGDKWGQDFAPYYIDKNNFETAPKGTASLWLNKDLFLDVCEKISKNTKGNNKFVNEDTKILRAIVDRGEKIYRTSQLKIYYQPRKSLKDSVSHLYNRGPRFVDYYIRPSSRFFPLLIFIYGLAIAVITFAIWKPKLLWYLLVALVILIVLFAAILGRKPKAILTLSAGMPAILIVFSAGVIKGTLFKIRKGFF